MMLREALFAKIHYAVVTECEVEYSGSIVIDQDLLDATGMVVNEKVLVGDCENGNRFETYILPGARGSGDIAINGAAARLAGVGHRVIILSFCQLTPEELARHRPKVIICDANNRIAETIEYDPPAKV
jgi:aspartate 1-decarboxylase